MSDSFSLVLSESARQDLEDIWDYLALESIDSADRMLDELFELCERLSEMPRMGRIREELLPGLRSFPVRRYMVYYRIHNQILEVVRVLHSRQDVDSYF